MWASRLKLLHTPLSGYLIATGVANRLDRLGKKAEQSMGWESPEEEASVYVDFLRLVLEMINTVVAGCLPQNPELVYALLHRQDVLPPLQVGHPLQHQQAVFPLPLP